MNECLNYSVFKEVLFPSTLESQSSQTDEELVLRKVIRYSLEESAPLDSLSYVVFDFETTGLDSQNDRIVEIGALKVNGHNGEPLAEFSSLVKLDEKFTIGWNALKITGITADMLKDQPTIEELMPKFLNFIEGSVLIAHNAEFDMSFLQTECLRQGYEILSWPCFCTLKLARFLLPQLPSKNLDTIAEHYGFTFESRHRSVGDVKVTTSVFQKFLADFPNFKTIKDLTDFSVRN